MIPMAAETHHGDNRHYCSDDTSPTEMAAAMIAGKLHSAQQDQAAGSEPLVPSPEAYRHALRMWLHWDQQHRKLTEALFECRNSPQRLEELVDACDRLRLQAAQLSQQLLADG